MRIFKWGNSLAVRLPANVVEALKLKAGDEVEVHVSALNTADKHSRDRALGRLMALREDLPVGWKFDRDEANTR